MKNARQIQSKANEKCKANAKVKEKATQEKKEKGREEPADHGRAPCAGKSISLFLLYVPPKGRVIEALCSFGVVRSAVSAPTRGVFFMVPPQGGLLTS